MHMAKKSYSSGSGPSQRQLRVGELIRRGLSEILQRGDLHDADLNRLSVTIGEVFEQEHVRADIERATERDEEDE